MRCATKEYIINTVYNSNILPVFSVCNTSCIFCSNGQNPAGVDVYRAGEYSLKDIEEMIGYLSPGRKIIIGEAASRITEGEPLFHKNFFDILGIIRKKCRNTPIQVTTNALLIDEKVIERLEKTGGIELNISVNSINPEKRRVLLGMKRADNIKEKIHMLKNRIKFSASCVCVPGVLEYDDLCEMAEFLAENGAEGLRVFLPGFTRLSDRYADLEVMFSEISMYLDSSGCRDKIPITVEPSFLYSLECRVEGVIRASAAECAGIKRGDIILEIDGEKVKSRAHAFYIAYDRSETLLTVKRDESIRQIKLLKRKNSSPGFVVYFDIDPETVISACNTIRRHGAANVLFVSSKLGHRSFESLMGLENHDFEYDIIVAENSFFGGNICCAGLLTVEDITACLKKHLPNQKKPDLIIIPGVMFDFKKTDITKRRMSDIEKEFSIPVESI